MAADFGTEIRVVSWSEIGRVISNVATLVNATSLGMVGKPKLLLDLEELSRKTLVSDLVYTPLETDLLRVAKKKGCRTVDGLGMLINQAVPGFSRWFGITPSVDQTTRDIIMT